MRITTLALTTLALTLTAACGNAADQQKKANAARDEANTKASAAHVEAAQKVTIADADADKKIAEASAAFKTLREDYRHAMTSNLVDLDKKIADLEAKAKTTKGKARADLDARLTAIQLSRGPFNEQFKGLDNATAENWDAEKATIEQRWTELKALVDKA